MRRSRRLLRVQCSVALLVVLSAGKAGAQSVRWNAPAPLQAGQESFLELVFEDCEPSGEVQLPDVTGLEFEGSPSTARQFSIVNMRSSASLTQSYRVRAAAEGSLRVPSFQVKTNKGRLRVPALPLNVARASVTRSGKRVPIDNVVGASVFLRKPTPYEGEVFPVDFYVSVEEGRRGNLIGTPDWPQADLATDGWGEGRLVNGRRIPNADPLPGSQGVHFRTRAFAPKAGRFKLPPVSQKLDLETGRRKRSFFFSEPERQRVTAVSGPTSLEVRPLPPAAPLNFTGAVGEFELNSTLVPKTVSVGEPVTWTLRLKGTGNWPGGVSLPARAIPLDVRTVKPKTQRNFAKGKIFEGSVSEDLVMIPTEPGRIELEPVEFAYFDPRAGTYRTSRVQPPSVDVKPTPAVPPRASPPPTPNLLPSTPSGEVATPPTSPGIQLLETLPGREDQPLLPRSALTGLDSSPGPWPHGTWLIALGMPPLALAAYWLILAVGRARQGDPGRSRREARAGLARALQDLDLARDRDARDLALQRWQCAGSVTFGVERAAPTLGQWADIETPEREVWVTLWAEADTALYGAEGELAQDWSERARRAAEQVSVPRFNPLRALLPRNLLALITLAMGLTTLGACGQIADAPDAEAVEAYRQGDLTLARKDLEQRVQLDENDSIARYNLGLVTAQQGELQRGLAHTTAAFLRSPRTPAYQWNLAVFSSELTRIDPAVERIAFGGGAFRLARQASPSTWQWLGLLATCLICAAAAVGLHRRFQPAAAPRRWTGPVAAIGLTMGLLSAVAVAQYGLLGRPSAAMLVEEATLRSIPTDADAPQSERILPAGSVVAIEGHFLGWLEVRRANGEKGWLRSSGIIRL